MRKIISFIKQGSTNSDQVRLLDCMMVITTHAGGTKIGKFFSKLI